MVDIMDLIIPGFVIAAVVSVIVVILSLRRIVPTNEVHVVRSGTQTHCYGATDNSEGNIYYEFPTWVPSLGVSVTKFGTNVFDLDIPDYEAYDKDRLPFVIDVKSFFRISSPVIASQRVYSQAELEKQLLGIVQGAARSILAKEDLNTIMGERNKYGEMFTKEVKDQLVEWGVSAVKNIELMDIRDSQGSNVIINIMAKKKSQIEMESRQTVAENARKANEAEILAKKEIELKQQEAEQAVGLRKAEVSQQVGIAEEKAKQEVQEQAKITTEKEMAVKRVQEVQAAEIKKQASIIKAEGDKNVVELNAEADVAKSEGVKKVKVLEAEAKKAEIELRADADLKAAKNEAQGIEAKGKAQAAAKELDEKAKVAGDIELFDKVQSNPDYQEFMINTKRVEALMQVGIEQAKNLGNAEIKIYATAETVTGGISKATNTFSPSNGFNVSSLLDAFSSTEVGEKIAKTLGSVVESKTKKD